MAPMLRGIALLPAVLLLLGAQEQEVEGQQAERLEQATQARAQFIADRRADQRLQDIGWKLAVANAQFCEDAPRSIGLQLQDAKSFRSPQIVQRMLNRSGDFTVRSAAAGSPAQLAGIEPYQSVLAIDGNALNTWAFDPERRWLRYEYAHDLIMASLAENGRVTVTLDGDVTHTLEGVPACATRFEMQVNSDTAIASGNRVRFGRAFPAFRYPEDEFAAIIGHELAHNVLGHSAWLGETKRNRQEIRMSEREADRLMPWLLANAGYPPEAALRFMTRWGPKHAGGWFRANTHDAWDERADMIAAEIPLVLEAMQEEGGADWRARFRREIIP